MLSPLAALFLLAVQTDTLRLPDLVTTASRLPVRAGALGGSYTVLHGEDLRARGVVHLLDALREVPGLVTVQTGSYGAAASMFLRGGESDYLKVLVDGVPMNLPGGAFNIAHLTVDNLDRIEVIRGPASVVHGADAMTGVIQLFTRDGSGRLAATGLVEAGGLGNRRGLAGASVSGAVGSLSLQVGEFRSDGRYAFNNAYRHRGASVRAATPASRASRAHATLRLGDVTAAFPTNSTGEAVDSNQYVTERQVAMSLGVERQVSRTVRLTLTGTGSRTLDGFGNLPDSPGDTSGFAYSAARSGQAHRTGVDLRASWADGGPVAVTAGVQYEDERQRQRGTTTSNFGGGPFTEVDAFRALRVTRAAYLEAASEIGGGIHLTGGLRLDDNSAFASEVTWRAGVVWQAPGGLTLRGQAGRAFKAPTFPELFAETPFEVGDPSLQPERASSWELGAEHRLAGGRLVVSAAYFRQAFDDLIQYTPAGPGEPTYGNVSAATSRGLEVGVQGVVARTLTLRAQATFLATEVTDGGGNSSPAWEEGLSLIRRPSRSGSLSAAWHPRAGLALHATVHHLGARDDLDFRTWPALRVTLPARTSTDLAATVGLGRLAKGLGLAGRAENLFDARWEEAVGFRGRGRLVMLGLRYGG